MNIVTSPASVAPSASDSSGAASRIAPTADGTDSNATPGAEPRAFGDVLSNSLGRGASGVEVRPVADGALPATRSGGRATTAEQSPDATIDVALAATADASTGVDAKSGAKADDDATTGDADAASGPIASDLAAQLALVSQWAALARPSTPTSTPAADAVARATARDPFDVSGKLDAVRGTGKSADGAANAATDATTVAGAAAADAAPSPIIGTIDARSMTAKASDRTSQRADRVASTIAAVTGSKSQTATTQDTDALQATAADRAAAAFDRLFAIAGASTQTAATDTASVAAALAAQPTSGRIDVAAAAAAPADPLASRELHETVGTPAWTHEVGQATLRMAANDLQNVSLRLNPEHLGPLDVQMRIDNGVANVQFAATHADTRHALEASRTTLDHMLGEQGIKLGDWSVGQQSSDPSSSRAFDAATTQRDGQRQASSRDGGSNDDAGVTTTTIVARTTSGLGLVDTFA